MSKLVLIAETIKEYLYQGFKIECNYELEKQESWLTTFPIQENYIEKWNDVNETYKKLVDNKYDLNDLIKSENYYSENGFQSIDIWFGNPFYFMIEFDEKQHFNQFRKLTLKENTFVGDFELYNKLSNRIAKPGTFGFQKINENLLFPWMYKNEDKQDNRIRQRAFRDYLKDIIPTLVDIKPTFRIPYLITNKKIKNFDKNDLSNVLKYANENKLYNSFAKK